MQLSVISGAVANRTPGAEKRRDIAIGLCHNQNDRERSTFITSVWWFRDASHGRCV
jgi:hypothetical protein